MIGLFNWFDAVFSLSNSTSEQEQEDRWERTLSKISKIAKIILIASIGALMFVANPTLFSMAFISGVVWDDKIQEVMGKIQLIWKTQPREVLILTGFASFLNLQVTWASASILFAANLGCKMIKYARRVNQEGFSEEAF